MKKQQGVKIISVHTPEPIYRKLKDVAKDKGMYCHSFLLQQWEQFLAAHEGPPESEVNFLGQED